MNKIRIIDLLNKIANDEEVPQKIKYEDEEYTYDDFNEIYEKENHENLFKTLTYYKGFCLNNEVKILDKEDKIEKLEKPNGYSAENYIEEMFDKINELIDELNKLKEK